MSRKVTVECERCGKEKRIFPCRIKAGRGRFCSAQCRNKALGKELAAKARLKITPEGRRRALERFLELIEWQKTHEQDHPSWKGNDVTYGRLHHWMRKRWGTPTGCEVCGSDDPNRTYDWANLSGRYVRHRSDFKRMCRSCHSKYDDKIQNITKQ